MAHDVFISYSSQDKTMADAVCATLEANGIRCWIAPRDVVPGMSYGQCLIKGITDSRVLVLVLSSHSTHSQFVTREVERAVSHGIPVIPFRIEDVKLSGDMEFFIPAIHWLDALNPPLEKHLQRLSDTTKRLLEEPSQGTNSAVDSATGTPSSTGSAAAVATAPVSHTAPPPVAPKRHIYIRTKPVVPVHHERWIAVATAVLVLAAIVVYNTGLPSFGLDSLPGMGPSPVGRWQWGSGGTVVFKGDKTMTYSNPYQPVENWVYRGTWEVVDPRARTFRLIWSSGVVDVLTLSPDGRYLQGTNNYNYRVTGTKVQ